MPRIFDNIDAKLLPALNEALAESTRADFCVGYFNLRGWQGIDGAVERWSGKDGECCRLLLGMQPLPREELRESLSVIKRDDVMSNQVALRLRQRLAAEFREQLTLGMPNNADESALRCLAAQLRAKKVRARVYLRHPLHAKLYLTFRQDNFSPVIGFLGSSNLTLAGLSNQGELNVDVLEPDTTKKLTKWFDDRWNDRWCLDISEELAEIINTSWAREETIPPYHIYLKIAYYLSQEARAGLSEFKLPKDFEGELLAFQKAAVQIAAHHLNKREGVLIGDVVGLGKTLMATAVARIFEDDQDLETLIICPKNLVEMWEDYRERYRMRARVMSLGKVIDDLPTLRRYRVVVIDESQNLRNREGRRYRAIQEYVHANESHCILLSATPYNKTYIDLSNQLRLFIREDRDLGIRPERKIKEVGETEFMRKHQVSMRSIAAFEASEHIDDWRDLMRLFMVRRTRTFIKDNYGEVDPATGRVCLRFPDGSLKPFPERIPRTVPFTINDRDKNDQYARLYSTAVVNTINHLHLPRYGLGNYVHASPEHPPTPREQAVLQNLSQAGVRLMGFCRTNLFKRLESSGQAFLQSVERHVLRNYIFLHAIANGKPLPIGTQDAEFLDARVNDEDEEIGGVAADLFDGDDEEKVIKEVAVAPLTTDAQFRQRAAEVYDEYESNFAKRFKWLQPSLFLPELKENLLADAKSLIQILQKYGDWRPDHDAKLQAFLELLTTKHPDEKVLVFSQFADTVRYLETQCKKHHLKKVAGVTGDSEHPTILAQRFSPESNRKRQMVLPERELRVLIATDVLSEGQNLQDSYIVVNYDLPWAIVRLVQRAGRVDRIGQKAPNICCYSFLPADGVERILRLRSRVRQRLSENAEVVGTDEAFFEDDKNDNTLVNLYHEKAGIIDDSPDTEVDLASRAYEIWKNAIKADPKLEKLIPDLPPVVYSAKGHEAGETSPEGVLVFVRTGDDSDALVWLDKNGRTVSESPLAILKAAECKADTPAVKKAERHHEMVAKSVQYVVRESPFIGGQLGRPSGARFRCYERLKRFADETKGTLFDTVGLRETVQDIYRYPMRELAKDILNRQLRSGISDEDLAKLVMSLREEGRLSVIHEEERTEEPQVICSMGLVAERKAGK